MILLNKPKNVITDCSCDDNTKIVLDFLIRGSFLITNNGTICYELNHPNFEQKNIYSKNKWRIK